MRSCKYCYELIIDHTHIFYISNSKILDIGIFNDFEI